MSNNWLKDTNNWLKVCRVLSVLTSLHWAHEIKLNIWGKQPYLMSEQNFNYLWTWYQHFNLLHLFWTNQSQHSGNTDYRHPRACVFTWFISYRLANYARPFGTLPFWLFWSNLDTRDLETYPRTYSGHFWNMSLFDYSRAIWVLFRKWVVSENQSFLDKGLIVTPY